MPNSQPSAARDVEQPAIGSSILLYDGECGLCQRTVRWMLRHDPQGRLLFMPLQQPQAAEVFIRHALDVRQINSAVLVRHFGEPAECVDFRSDAILGCLRILGGGWALLAAVARLVPRALRDGVYNLLARNRHRLRVNGEICSLPNTAERARFLDL